MLRVYSENALVYCIPKVYPDSRELSFLKYTESILTVYYIILTDTLRTLEHTQSTIGYTEVQSNIWSMQHILNFLKCNWTI